MKYLSIVTGGAILLLACAGAPGQSGGPAPRMGYLYPAGGQQGTTVEVIAGGQYLRGARQIYVTGDGVRGTVTGYVRPLNNDVLKAIRQRLRAVREARKKGTPAAPPHPDAVPLPDHPLLRDLENLTAPELNYVDEFFFSKKRQKNTQIGELALLKITIDPGAAPGERELRISGAGGLTNPMRFHVGPLPEVQEREPNDPPDASTPGERNLLQTPVLVNGQILPGDVDRFWFQAKQGQQLVITAAARALNPYLADAVPGWFQAALTLYGPDGSALAFQDDYRFDPDPVLCYPIPEDGNYALEMRDAIYRGREDFVYRIAIGELPFITEHFPPGIPADRGAQFAIAGWNLPASTLAPDPTARGRAIREARVADGAVQSNSIRYTVEPKPALLDTEPNDSLEAAQLVVPPAVIHGRIDQPGDADWFRMEGRAGETVVAEVLARRLHSPADTALYLKDSAGNTLAWNDDAEQPNTGLLTHHADPYLRATLPADGDYFVRIVEVQHNGSSAHLYRLRIGPPEPDFEVYVTPSSLSVRPGGSVPVTLHAVRRDGFDGAIDVEPASDQEGFVLDGARIPAGRESIRATLTAPAQPEAHPVALRLVAHAVIGGSEVRRAARPAEDMMQAFFYRHLVPSRQLLVSVQGKRRPGPPLAAHPAETVRIPAGGTAEYIVCAALPKGVTLTLSEPPAGIALQEVRPVADGLALVIAANREHVAPGFADNLIVEASTDDAATPEAAGKKRKARRVALGVLPAIPIEVVSP